MTTSVYHLFRDVADGPDLLFMGPTKQCVCGSTVFLAVVWFDPDDPEREIAGRFTEMKCVDCGSLVRAVTEDPRETT